MASEINLGDEFIHPGYVGGFRATGIDFARAIVTGVNLTTGKEVQFWIKECTVIGRKPHGSLITW